MSSFSGVNVSDHLASPRSCQQRKTRFHRSRKRMTGRHTFYLTPICHLELASQRTCAEMASTAHMSMGVLAKSFLNKPTCFAKYIAIVTMGWLSLC